jgi:hypothetical protein
LLAQPTDAAMLTASAMTKEARFIVGGLLPRNFKNLGNRSLSSVTWVTRNERVKKSWVY